MSEVANSLCESKNLNLLAVGLQMGSPGSSREAAHNPARCACGTSVRIPLCVIPSLHPGAARTGLVGGSSTVTGLHH